MLRATSAKEIKTISTTENYITAVDYIAWEKFNKAILLDQGQRQQRAIDDAVIKDVMHARQAGLSLQDAGRVIVRNFHYGCRDGINFTPAAVRHALKSIGWNPKRKTAGGDDE